MAEKRRFLDAWILETNTVYREVPYNIVTDWLQQGRLLADDKLRPSGTAEWLRVGDSPSFAAYLPRSEPFRADDQAEAFEPVEMDLTWRHRHDDDDDDVDMIPLIDVSLVLLVFFIMTTTGVVLASNIPTPPAVSGVTRSEPSMLWVGIDRGGNGEPVYSLGEGDRPPADDDKTFTTLPQLMARFDEKLKERDRPAEVLVRGHEDLPAGVVRKVQVELEKRGRKIATKFQSVSEKGGGE